MNSSFSFLAIMWLVTGGEQLAFGTLYGKIGTGLVSIPKFGAVGAGEAYYHAAKEGRVASPGEVASGTAHGAAMGMLFATIPLLARATKVPEEKLALDKLDKELKEVVTTKRLEELIPRVNEFLDNPGVRPQIKAAVAEQLKIIDKPIDKTRVGKALKKDEHAKRIDEALENPAYAEQKKSLEVKPDVVKEGEFKGFLTREAAMRRAEKLGILKDGEIDFAKLEQLGEEPRFEETTKKMLGEKVPAEPPTATTRPKVPSKPLKAPKDVIDERLEPTVKPAEPVKGEPKPSKAPPKPADPVKPPPAPKPPGPADPSGSGTGRSSGDIVKEVVTRKFNDFMFKVVDKNRPIQNIQKSLKTISEDIDLFLQETQRPKVTSARVKEAWT